MSEQVTDGLPRQDMSEQVTDNKTRHEWTLYAHDLC